jgi:hypothetical protein
MTTQAQLEAYRALEEQARKTAREIGVANALRGLSRLNTVAIETAEERGHGFQSKAIRTSGNCAGDHGL